MYLDTDRPFSVAGTLETFAVRDDGLRGVRQSCPNLHRLKSKRLGKTY